MVAYLTKASTGYLVEPFNGWYVGALRNVLDNGTNLNAPLPPSSQHNERYNCALGHVVPANKRASKAHLLDKIIPELLIIDDNQLTDKWPMTLTSPLLSSQIIVVARAIHRAPHLFRVAKPPGASSQANPINTVFYTNRDKFKNMPVLASRIKSHTIGRDSRFSTAKTQLDFEREHLSLNRTVKTMEGWVCSCNHFQYKGVCADAIVDEQLDALARPADEGGCGVGGFTGTRTGS